MPRHAYTLTLVCALAGSLFQAEPVRANNVFTDSFEGSALNPYWTPTQQFGAVSLSTDVAHSGSQSAKFSSSSGGQRDIFLQHFFATPQKGDVSVWFYDAAPGQETLYEQLSLSNPVTGWYANIGTQDFDANCYMAQLYNSSTRTVLVLLR